MRNMEMAVLDEDFVLARFAGDDRGYRLAAPISLPPWFDSALWVKAFVGITTSAVWVDISKAYLFEEHKVEVQVEGAA